MKRFSQKQLESLKSIFVCQKDSYFYISSDKSSVDAYVGKYLFYFHKNDGYVYMSIYKYDQFFDNGVCIFRQHFGSFSDMILSLLGFQMSNLS